MTPSALAGDLPTTADGLFAMFDHMNVPLGRDGTPYAYYEALRDVALSTPIGRSEQWGGFWVVATYDACQEILRNHTAFSNVAVTFPAWETGQGSIWLASRDEPVHRQERSFVNRPFSSRSVAAYDPAIREMTNNLIDGFCEHGAVDLAEVLGGEVPARLTARILGLAEEQGARYRAWTHTMTRDHLSNPASAARVIGEMHTYFREVLAEKRRAPGGDVLSLVSRSEINGVRLSDDDLLGFCMALLIGGIDNSAHALSTAFWRLGWDVELRRRLVDDPRLIPGFVEELLRYYSPAAVDGRLVVEEDVTVAGVELARNDVVLTALAVANRDPRQFTHPDAFVPDRSPNRHLGLGTGIHQCLGSHLVKVEARAVIEEFLLRIPEYELDPTKQPAWVGAQGQGMESVPVVFPADRPRG